MFLSHLKPAPTMLFFLLIKMLERGAGLTGPCLAGRQRVNGPELNRRHLWAASSLCLTPPNTTATDLFRPAASVSVTCTMGRMTHRDLRVDHKEQSRRTKISRHWDESGRCQDSTDGYHFFSATPSLCKCVPTWRRNNIMCATMHSLAILVRTPIQLFANTNQSVAWQWLTGFRHLDMVKMTYESSVRRREKALLHLKVQ